MSVERLFRGPRPVRDSNVIEFRSTQRVEFVDVTDLVAERVQGSGVLYGACVVYSTHTTCAVLINELEDGAHADLTCALDRLVPPHIYYAHDDLTRRSQNLEENEPANGAAHVAHMLMGATSQTIPIQEGVLTLGRWQRIFAVELDGPRRRRLIVQEFSAGGYGPHAS